MVIEGGWNKFVIFSRTIDDAVQSSISFACALTGLPSGQQVLTLTWASFGFDLRRQDLLDGKKCRYSVISWLSFNYN